MNGGTAQGNGKREEQPRSSEPSPAAVAAAVAAAEAAEAGGKETAGGGKGGILSKLLFRILFVVFMAAAALNLYQFARPDLPTIDGAGGAETFHYETALWLTIGAALVGVAVVIFEWRFQRRFARDMVAVVFGVAAGLAVSFLLMLLLLALCSVNFSGAEPTSVGETLAAALAKVQPLVPLIVLACCYLGITIVMQTRNDFRFLIPYVDFSSRGTQEGGLLLDTSAIIDGRIAEICETKLISVPVVIPDFVIRELQTLADSADRMKRLRGRRGLDIAAKMQKSEACHVAIRPTDAPTPCSVDQELVRCAKEIVARIVTTDFNLNKVSQIEGVAVVNVNDIANALKPAVIPGERLTIKVLRQGQEPGQGVGYLDDGTMVVVENGRDHIGNVVASVVTGTIQTSAGRMIFVRPGD